MNEHTSHTESIETIAPNTRVRQSIVPFPRRKVLSTDAGVAAKRPRPSKQFSENDDDPGPAAA
jgi:hypothetical protein